MPETKKPLWTSIISFRLTEEQQRKLNSLSEKNAMLSAISSKQLARKIVCDYLAGRLEYKNEADRDTVLDNYGGYNILLDNKKKE